MVRGEEWPSFREPCQHSHGGFLVVSMPALEGETSAGRTQLGLQRSHPWGLLLRLIHRHRQWEVSPTMLTGGELATLFHWQMPSFGYIVSLTDVFLCFTVLLEFTLRT